MKKTVTIYIVTAMIMRTVYDSVQGKAVEYRFRGPIQITTDKQKAEEWTAMYQDMKSRLTAMEMTSTDLTVLLEDNEGKWNYNRQEFADIRALFIAA